MTQLWPQFVSWWLLKHTGGSSDVLHLIKYSSQVFGSPFKANTRCPQKKGNFLLNTLWSSFLSPQWSKLKNFSAYQDENFLRYQKLNLISFLKPFLRELWPFQTLTWFFLGHPVNKIVYHDTNVSLASMSVLTLINHFELWGEYFTKWSTSGEPPVCLKSHQDTSLGHSGVMHYFTN